LHVGTLVVAKWTKKWTKLLSKPRQIAMARARSSCRKEAELHHDQEGNHVSGSNVVAGLDGCRNGWVLVTTAADGRGSSTVEYVAHLHGVISSLDGRELDAAGIDIPIGLPDVGPRRCDVEARRLLGPRRSSVFPAPVRGLLGASHYDVAAARCRALSGKGLSRQAFGILAKVGEVDRLMTPLRQRHLIEVHPEVSLCALAYGPMSHYKKTPEGRAERMEVLRAVFPDIDMHVGVRTGEAGPDDIIDAFAVAWSARRWLARTYLRLGGDLDGRGLRMEIVA